MTPPFFRAGVALAALGLASAPALAQTIALDEVLVTAGRTAAPAESVGRAYTILSGDELAVDGVRDVAEALRRVPGLAVSNSGAFGGLTQVRVRGAEGNHVLVLIDGVDASETSTGEFDFGTLLLSEIERIEVLRGPQSAFFGSNALAGVINVITKGGVRNGREVTATAEGGSFGTAFGSAGVRGGGENYDVAVSAAARHTDGFDLSRFGSERDGSENLTLNGRGTVDLSPTLSLDGTLRLVNQEVETDGTDFRFPATPTQGLAIDTDEESRIRDMFGSVGLTSVLLDGALTQRLRLTGSDTTRRFLDEGSRVSASTGERVAGLYQASYAFDTPRFADAEHVVTGGYEYERETFRALDPVFDATQRDRQSRDLHALVAEYRGTFLRQFYVTGAVRQDWNDRFADADTYALSAAWQIPNTGTRLHSSIGTGVTNPTFFEQFGFIPGTFNGNPALRPERSLGWDVGVEQSLFDGLLVADVTYFNQNLRNEIVTVFTPDFRSSAENQDGSSRREGVEVSATLALALGLTASASYTYTDASDPDGRIEVRRPRHSGSVTAAYSFADDRARVFTEVLFNGSFEDVQFVDAIPGDRARLSGFTLVKIGGSYSFTDSLEGFARVENLLDEDYEEVFGFQRPGRSVFAGLTAKF